MDANIKRSRVGVMGENRELRQRIEKLEAELARRPKLDGLVSAVRLTEANLRITELEAENKRLEAEARVLRNYAVNQDEHIEKLEAAIESHKAETMSAPTPDPRDYMEVCEDLWSVLDGK